MPDTVEELYRQIQTLPMSERLDLLSKVFADLKASLELHEELAAWDRLSDEALELFEHDV